MSRLFELRELTRNPLLTASKAAPVTPRPVSSSIQKVVVAGEGLPMGDLAPLHATIQVWIRDPAQNQTVPSDGQIRTCGTISTESPEGTLTCVLGDDLSATLSNSSEFELWIYPIVYRGPMVRISSKRAEEKVGWTKLGSIVPAPVIDYVDQIPTITTIATSFTIQGRNFAPGVTQVEFDPIASVTPMCEVTEVTETQVTCKLSQLSVGTLTARVVANYGPSNTQSVAAIAPDESLRLGLGVGIPVGLIVICGVIFLIVILVKVVSRRRLRSMFTSKATKFRDAMSSSELAEINAMEQKAKEALAQWTVPYSDIKFGKEVGKGSFGKVFVGKWNGKKVAIKEAQLEDPRAREEFFKEAFLMLGMTPHVRILLLKTAKAKPGLKYFGVPSLQPNVVQVLGISIVTETHTCYILMDIMYGSLDKLVYNPENRAKLDSDALTKFARGIAAGMAHLSTEGIIHRDLAVRNVLISKDGAPKVADFGMSRRVESGGSGQTVRSCLQYVLQHGRVLINLCIQNAVVGPLRWMSREALLQTYSEKTDVWAYGCTLLGSQLLIPVQVPRMTLIFFSFFFSFFEQK
jgi:RIO-like serine/threonine protein kinase